MIADIGLLNNELTNYLRSPGKLVHGVGRTVKQATDKIGEAYRDLGIRTYVKGVEPVNRLLNHPIPVLRTTPGSTMDKVGRVGSSAGVLTTSRSDSVNVHGISLMNLLYAGVYFSAANNVLEQNTGSGVFDHIGGFIEDHTPQTPEVAFRLEKIREWNCGSPKKVYFFLSFNGEPEEVKITLQDTFIYPTKEYDDFQRITRGIIQPQVITLDRDSITCIEEYCYANGRLDYFMTEKYCEEHVGGILEAHFQLSIGDAKGPMDYVRPKILPILEKAFLPVVQGSRQPTAQEASMLRMMYLPMIQRSQELIEQEYRLLRELFLPMIQGIDQQPNQESYPFKELLFLPLIQKN